jgi:hypothetical protein
MYDRIIAKRGEEWVNKTSVTPPLTSACNKPEKWTAMYMFAGGI